MSRWQISRILQRSHYRQVEFEQIRGLYWSCLLPCSKYMIILYIIYLPCLLIIVKWSLSRWSEACDIPKMQGLPPLIIPQLCSASFLFFFWNKQILFYKFLSSCQKWYLTIILKAASTFHAPFFLKKNCVSFSTFSTLCMICFWVRSRILDVWVMIVVTL